jgi:hypothetical protein
MLLGQDDPEPQVNLFHPYMEITDSITSPKLDRVSIDYAINLDMLKACPPISSPQEVNVDV